MTTVIQLRRSEYTSLYWQAWMFKQVKHHGTWMTSLPYNASALKKDRFGAPSSSDLFCPFFDTSYFNIVKRLQFTIESHTSELLSWMWAKPIIPSKAMEDRPRNRNWKLTWQVFHAYTYSTAAWLALQSLPLIAGPSIIVTMLLDETRPVSRMWPTPWKCRAHPLASHANPSPFKSHGNILRSMPRV